MTNSDKDSDAATRSSRFSTITVQELGTPINSVVVARDMMTRVYWRIVDAKDPKLPESTELDQRRRQFIEELIGERRHQPNHEHFALLEDGFAFANIDSFREESVRELAKAAAAKYELLAVEVTKKDVWPNGGD